LQRLTDDDTLRTALAAQGRRVYTEQASRLVLGQRWRQALER
jgi:hypothetical protein